MISTVTNQLLTTYLPSITLSYQRGFVKGRQLLSNVVDIDCEMRILGAPPEGRSAETPIGKFLDFQAAFPSLSHRWIFATLRMLGLPAGLQLFVAAIYCANIALYRAVADEAVLYEISSGVLQGCPGSGTVYTVATDFILNAISAVTDKVQRGIFRACADDVALALPSLCALIPVHNIYEEAESLTHLVLKPKLVDQ